MLEVVVELPGAVGVLVVVVAVVVLDEASDVVDTVLVVMPGPDGSGQSLS